MNGLMKNGAHRTSDATTNLKLSWGNPTFVSGVLGGGSCSQSSALNSHIPPAFATIDAFRRMFSCVRDSMAA